MYINLYQSKNKRAKNYGIISGNLDFLVAWTGPVNEDIMVTGLDGWKSIFAAQLPPNLSDWESFHGQYGVGHAPIRSRLRIISY